MLNNSFFSNIMKPIRQILTSLLLTLVLLSTSMAPAWAFCGFYVGGANAQLFNKSSQVIIARQDEKTVLTMANDFQGSVKDFALVVPVPVAIKREQVNIGDKEIITKLDTFSQPRLVEYFDPTPCPIAREEDIRGRNGTTQNSIQSSRVDSDRSRAAALGVTIEDRFQAGEYNILILSAKDSNGLETWLRGSGYQLPRGASEVLRPYIRQQMKFFVAKVNLAEFNKTGSAFLRPLQIAYQSPKFMLPIRLGMLNAQGDQDLVVYLLSPKGRVQIANYRTVEVPTGQEIPEYIKKDFGKFYTSAFQKSYERENKKVAFLEYAWDVSNCDPCTTTPPDSEELKKAGVFWQSSNGRGESYQPTYITRLHVRYNRSKFPEDLVFQETSNRENFQGRYVLNHPYREAITCSAAEEYRRSVKERQQKEVNNLVSLTGWQRREIEARQQEYIEPDRAPIQPRGRTRQRVR
jgi:hypothetical protein